MFRLNKLKRRDGILITIEGEIQSDNVGILESECLETLKTCNSVTITIKNVTEIDVEGSALLKRLAKTKARIRATGIYSQYLLRNIKSDAVA